MSLVLRWQISSWAPLAARCSAGCVVKTDKRPTSTMCSVVFPDSDPHRSLQYSLNGLGLAVREILGEVGFRELMQRGEFFNLVLGAKLTPTGAIGWLIKCV